MTLGWLALACLAETFSGPNWGSVVVTGDGNAHQVVLVVTDDDPRPRSRSASGPNAKSPNRNASANSASGSSSSANSASGSSANSASGSSSSANSASGSSSGTNSASGSSSSANSNSGSSSNSNSVGGSSSRASSTPSGASASVNPNDPGAHSGLGISDWLAAPDRLVVQVRAASVIAALAKSPSCAYPAARLEELSHYVQMKLGLARYLQPALVGSGSGAALVLAALAQGPPNTFAGVVTVDFCPNLTVPKALCRGRSLRMEGGKMRAPEHITEPWVALQGSKATCSLENIKRYAASAPTADVQEVPGGPAGPGGPGGPAGPAGPNAAGLQRELLLAALQRLQPLGEPAPPPANPEVHDLPVVEVPVTAGDSPYGAVIVSGDGGWASIDREIAETFAAEGIPVAGLSSLQYFWKARDPNSAAGDLQRLIEHYRTTWHKSHMLVVGFSLGADVLPFMLSRLPPATQDMIKYVALLGPSTEASFEFHLTDWIGGAAAGDALPVLPELQKLPCKRLMCMYASQDGESPCPQLSCANRVKIPGGHHFGGDYPALAHKILEAVAAQDAAPEPSP